MAEATSGYVVWVPAPTVDAAASAAANVSGGVAKLWCAGEDFPPGGKVGNVGVLTEVWPQAGCTNGCGCCDRLPACANCKRTGTKSKQVITLDLSGVAVMRACCGCEAHSARRVRCDACQDKMDASRAGTKLTAEQVGEKFDGYVRQSDETEGGIDNLLVKGAAYERLANSDPVRNDKPPYPAARAALCSHLDGKKNYVDPDNLSTALDRITEELAKQRGLPVGDALDLKAFESAVLAWGLKEGKDTVVRMPYPDGSQLWSGNVPL